MLVSDIMLFFKVGEFRGICCIFLYDFYNYYYLVLVISYCCLFVLVGFFDSRVDKERNCGIFFDMGCEIFLIV